MSLFDELKRRNVIRVGLAYVVAGWLLIEISSVALEAFGAPGWVPKAVAVLLAIGFPIALIFAWAFEVTPDGIKRESEVDRAADQHTAKRLDLVTIVLLVGAIGLFLSEPLWRRTTPPTPAGPNHETGAALDEFPAPQENRSALQGSPPPQQETADAQNLGIAVLPFENLSSDADNAYFAGGVHEEVLTNLSRIPDLRVISRTSMLKIAETELDVRAIGVRLGVSHVIEGSVRRAGDRVRVTVQLIDAASDEHIWSENYDRTLDDIFTIQSDIALAIADRLQATLSAETAAAIAERPTDSDEAYQLYLRAREHRREWRGAGTFRLMIPLLERAVEIDPEFLNARALLVKVYGRMPWLREDPDGTFERKAAEQLQILRDRWPNRVETRIAEAGYDYTVNNDYQRAVEILEPLVPQLPNDVDIASMISSSYKRLGYKQRYVDAAKRWVSLTVEDSGGYGDLAIAHSRMMDFEAAERVLMDGLERNPDSASLRRTLVIVYQILGRHGDVVRVSEEIQRLAPENRLSSFVLWSVQQTRGLAAAEALYADQVGDTLDKDEIGYASVLARVYLREGVQPERAEALLREAMAVAEGMMAAEVKGSHGQRDIAMRAAGVAAILGEVERAEELIALGEAAPENELFDRITHTVALAGAEAHLGRRDEAMARIRAFNQHRGMMANSLLIGRFQLDLAFGDHPDYQRYLGEIGATP